MPYAVPNDPMPAAVVASPMNVSDGVATIANDPAISTLNTIAEEKLHVWATIGSTTAQSSSPIPVNRRAPQRSTARPTSGWKTVLESAAAANVVPTFAGPMPSDPCRYSTNTGSNIVIVDAARKTMMVQVSTCG